MWLSSRMATVLQGGFTSCDWGLMGTLGAATEYKVTLVDLRGVGRVGLGLALLKLRFYLSFFFIVDSNLI